MKKMILAVCVIGILLTGCSNKAGNQEREREKEEMNERVELTKEQEELLCRISIDEDDVREGKLASWQKEVLNQYNYAMAYLERKYPSYSFEIITCTEKNKMNSYTTFGFVEENDEDGYYEMYMDVEEKESGNTYKARDNFYGEIKEDEYARKLSELLQENFAETIEVKSNMSTVEGEEFGEDLDLDRVISGELKTLPRNKFTILTSPMEESEYQRIFEALKDFIQDRAIRGAYQVDFVNEANPEEELYTDHFFGD